MSARWQTSPEGVLTLLGRVTLQQADALVQTLPLPGGQTWTLDVSQAEGEAALVLVLLACWRQAQQAQQTLVLQGASESLIKLLHLSGLDGLFS